MGMRATGYPVHERFIDTLIGRLKSVGVRDVHTEPVPFTKWTVGHWSLEADGAAVPTAVVHPRALGKHAVRWGVWPSRLVDSATTPPPGSLGGKIALFDVPFSGSSIRRWSRSLYGSTDPQHLDRRKRVLTAAVGSRGRPRLHFDSLPAAGAVGCIRHHRPSRRRRPHGSYYPYDGTIRRVPGVFVDAAVGARLHSEASSGASARLTLTATTEHYVSRNVVGTIPGRGNEIVILNSHTDGPNAVEDNGPNTIVAICQYLTRCPARPCRGRSWFPSPPATSTVASVR